MTNRSLALACMLVVSAPVSAFADVSQPAPSLQPVSTISGSESLTCRYYYYEGMVISRQDCRTKREWDRLRRETQQNITNFQIRSMTMSGR